MALSFGLAVATLLGGLACIVVYPKMWVGVGLCIFAIALCASSIFTFVPNRSMTVNIATGKPVRHLINGFNAIPPWESIEAYPEGVQTFTLTGKQAPTVRMATGALATLEKVEVRWEITSQANLKKLYEAYGTFEQVRKDVIEGGLLLAITEAFEQFDPLMATRIQALSGDAETLASTMYSVMLRLEAQVPPGIVVKSVTIPVVKYDAATTEDLQQLQHAVAETHIADQRAMTARASVDSVNPPTPEALIQRCLELTERLVQVGQTAGLAGWSCIPGTLPHHGG